MFRCNKWSADLIDKNQVLILYYLSLILFYRQEVSPILLHSPRAKSIHAIRRRLSVHLPLRSWTKLCPLRRRSDSLYPDTPLSRRSISEWITFWNGVFPPVFVTELLGKFHFLRSAILLHGWWAPYRSDEPGGCMYGSVFRAGLPLRTWTLRRRGIDQVFPRDWAE